MDPHAQGRPAGDAAWFYDLPPDLVAQEPPPRRGDARLLRVAPGRGVLGEMLFRELPRLLRGGDLLVVNESRVLPARLATAREGTGGRVEVLLVAPQADGSWRALARPARRLRSGQRLRLVGPTVTADAPVLHVVARHDDGSIAVASDPPPDTLARRWGEMPLPPYIRRGAGDPRGAADRERYQTVFADRDADRSVAAPTAGLHFSPTTLAALANRGVGVAPVLLHVGPGTFQPPTGEQIVARRLHGERFILPAATARQVTRTRAAGGRVIAVGTTSLRVLETVARLDLPASGGPDEHRCDDDGAVFTGTAQRRDGHWEVAGTTRLFIAPPDRVECVDGLLTNFHLPGSSLLMLVAAVVGREHWRPIYTHAVARGMRFYSYGDCMLTLPPQSEEET